VLEKILRSLPECGKVFVLVRPKKGLSVEQRLQEEIFQSPIFDRLKAKIDDYPVYGVWPRAPSTFYSQQQQQQPRSAPSSTAATTESSAGIQPNNTSANNGGQKDASSGKDEKKKRNKNENSLGPRPATPKFDEYVRHKVKAVGGDVAHEHIGLTKADRSALINGLPNGELPFYVVCHSFLLITNQHLARD